MVQRRQYERIVITSTASVEILSGESAGHSFDASVINISQGGLGLCAQRSAKTETKVEIDLNFIDTEGIQCRERVEGFIIWEKKMGPYFVIGVEFSGLDEQNHPGLMRSLHDADHRKFIDGIGPVKPDGVGALGHETPVRMRGSVEAECQKFECLGCHSRRQGEDQAGQHQPSSKGLTEGISEPVLRSVNG